MKKQHIKELKEANKITSEKIKELKKVIKMRNKIINNY